MQLILSLFHGADLFGRGFESEGFCVVRAAEIELGFDIRNFTPSRHKFDGIIAGTPCQDFSLARRTPPSGEGLEMLKEFKRVVTEAAPLWYLLENVPTVPTLEIEGYQVQRFDLNANQCGLKQNRPRHFQFGTKEGFQLHIERETADKSQNEPCAMASEGHKANRRSLADFCELQGLPRDFRLKMLSIEKNYQVIGNGVALPVAATIAKAIKTFFAGPSQIKPSISHILENYTSRTVTLCACKCGRAVTGRQKTATAACRKRIQRRKNLSPGAVTV